MKEQINKKNCCPSVMVIGMVLNRDLISKSLIDIKNTNARDLIRCLAIEKFFDCNVKTSVSLTEGGSQY